MWLQQAAYNFNRDYIKRLIPLTMITLSGWQHKRDYIMQLSMITFDIS